MSGILGLAVSVFGWLFGKYVKNDEAHSLWVQLVGVMEKEGYIAVGSQATAQAQKDALNQAAKEQPKQ